MSVKVKCYVCGQGRECRHGAAIGRPTHGDYWDEHGGYAGQGRWMRGFTMPPRLLTDAEARKVVPMRVGRG